MATLRSNMSVPVSAATSSVTMQISVTGVKRFKLRVTLALWIIKLATIVSPIVTRITID